MDEPGEWALLMLTIVPALWVLRATRVAGWIVHGVGMASWGLVAVAAVFATSIEAIFIPDEASLPIPATP